MDSLNLTSLRENLFKIIDKVIISGVPQKLERKGKKLKIVLDEKIDKFDNLVPHKSIIGEPEKLIKAKPYLWQEPRNV
ncbi:hypothetical protein A2W14_02475 [Candidatus Gottesmanbacteria bacterium RBG_16_37_8]|uniref:Antitoxin n=1 Tax=Candidatus Gottesmanbacteria bacterium RBG_16_37_8 TaxID=1798371 RepID=A0A1F5YPX2_9BACT|nr:MAG: hypothetical protein A2W14_02475 [Candidatus Gottesmanbacteria bacterium RBG_16_37_8]